MSANARMFAGQFIVIAVLFSLVLFIPAGTFAWPAGWFWLVVFLGFFLGISLWLFKYNPGLAEERLLVAKSDQSTVDKLLYPAMLLGFMVWLGFAGWDGARYDWSPVPLWLRAVGFVALLGTFYLLYQVFKVNSYLSTLVRVQAERGHEVVSTGPYGLVRHPMYAAILAFVVSTSLMLNSWHAALAAIPVAILLGYRAHLEERLLRANLSGYDAYMTRVKYRLIPLVW